MIGEVVNYRYEIMEQIGEGTIFTVYKARDKMLNRLVALKMLKADLQQNKIFADSLCAGYRAASTLNHPNIARVLDADNGASGCFVVCEYVHGVSIKERVARGGALAVPLALDIFVPVMQAMDYAHTSGILHGNLRSQDIIVSPDGEVKVTDFGLANALASSPEVANTYVMRSVYYEAPEIAEEGAITAASDIYSLGVILYEMVTGALPYTGNTAVAVAVKRMKEAPIAPRLHNTGVPKSLSDLILKAIEVAPDSRFHDVPDMLGNVLAVREGVRVGRPAAPMAAPTPRRVIDEDSDSEDYPRERPVWLRLTLLILLFVGVVLFVMLITLRQRGGPAAIQAPNFIGMTMDQANTEATRLGLKLQQDGTELSEMYTVGQICAQDPMAGENVPRNNPVKVKVSAGSGQAEVPRVVGLTEGEANNLITQGGFTVGPSKQKSDDTVPVGSVISQDPPASSKWPPGTVITLTLSTGPATPVEGSTPTPGATEENTKPLKEQSFNIGIKVPDSATEPKEVRVVVDDQTGETDAYDATHQPGDKFNVRVTGKGAPVRIRVYIGDELVEDNTPVTSE